MRVFVTFIIFTSLLITSTGFAQSIDQSPEELLKSKIKPATKSALASQSLLLDISPVGTDKVVAVGHYGHILLSNDGENWQQANVPVQATLTRVYFLNEQLGWAVGHDATILHSSDGGLNWQIQQYLPLLEKPLLDVYFKNAQQGIAIGAYGQFFRTNNGGVTWQSEFHQEFLLSEDVDYINDLKTEDEAAYLDEIAFILPHFNGIVVENERLFLLGESGLLAQSDNFGISWQKFDKFYNGSFFTLARTSRDSLLVAGLRGHVYRLSSNDNVWQESETDTTALLNDIVLANEQRVFILGNNGMLLVSVDDGLTFTHKQQKDGKPLIAGIWFKNKLLAVSDVGIKVLNITAK
ncbi:WD40/YVTN/BNR-like repeat-containing protein [Colwellia echini]|uniref:Photosynthesis system II assembly factor Ycf48/Hcf136-like domain-containing protein n=1 Tax=Colwellia echini TaxID=1982103 RepID=A0ABY3MZX4_9GAMM|nr:YCF48-related protein [Colwellia echini]TYK66767.1 hypothetical protein CWS31_002995 [Colwellia echini]